MSENLRTVARVKRTYKLSSGKTLVLSPLTLRDFASIQDAALQWYRRDWLKARMENIDLLPEDKRERAASEFFDKASSFTLADLPARRVGTGSDSQQVEYAAWWSQETIDGMIFAAWLAITKEPSQNTLTLDDVSDILTDDLQDAVNSIGEISAAKNPNCDDGEPVEKKARRRRRKNR